MQEVKKLGFFGLLIDEVTHIAVTEHLQCNNICAVLEFTALPVMYKPSFLALMICLQNLNLHHFCDRDESL